MKRLSGKRAVITGAASGIGRASVALFVREGACVIACDVDEKGLAETVEAARRDGGEVRGTVASVADSARVKGLVDECVREYGGLDVFYANAGVSGGLVSLLMLEPEESSSSR